MKKNSNQYNLKREIEQLEAEQSLKEKLLREQFYLTYESLKPVNLLMNTVKDFISMPLVVEKSISTIAGFFAGYISKKMKVDTNTSIFGKMIVPIVKFGVSNIIAKNPNILKYIGQMMSKKDKTEKIDQKPQW
jgi:hypothetical protein